MNILTYLLVKETFWDQLKQEFSDVFEMFGDFFLMVKEVTYDVLAEAIGNDLALMFVIAVGAICVMLVCLAIINR